MISPTDRPIRSTSPTRSTSRPTTRRALTIVAVAAATLASACSGTDRDGSSPTTSAPERASATTTPRTDRLSFPTTEWEQAGPANDTVDPAALATLDATARDAASSCVAITRNGELVHDAAWPGPTATPRQSFSVTKSLTSTLVGIAQRDGHLDVTDRVSDYVPEWLGTPSEDVTIEQVLSNTSGREWSLPIDYAQMALGAHDKTAFAIGLGQAAAPDSVWAYNNSAIQVLSAVLSAATGVPVDDYAKEQVFEPLGMADSTLGTDAAGNPLTFMGLTTTCQDLARLGLLMLADGSWDGEQILAPEYVEAATGRSSSELNAAYGWLWWLNQVGHISSPTIAVSASDAEGPTDGQLAPDAPEDTFWALGFGGQYMVVIPEEGIVAVRLGAPPPTDHPLSVETFTDHVLDAVGA